MLYSDLSATQLRQRTPKQLAKTDSGLRLIGDGTSRQLVSRYNPTFFAEFFAEQNIATEGVYFLYGIGDGELLHQIVELESDAEVYALECSLDVAAYAEQHYGICALAEGEPRLHLCLSEQADAIQSFLARVPQSATVRYYKPSLVGIPAALGFLREWLDNRLIDLNSQRDNAAIAENVHHNEALGLPNLLALARQLFADLPVIITAGGPSLRTALPQINTVGNHFVHIAIGRNGALLEQAKCQPTLWAELDPQHNEILWQRASACDARSPMVIMDSTSLLIHDNFGGIIAMIPSQMNEQQRDALPTGKSTVAFALDLALSLGARQVYMAGLDLCYDGGKSHASGPNYGFTATGNTPKVRCNDGEMRFS